MPWKECVVKQVRLEFVKLAMIEDSNMTALCLRFGISRRCGYKWLARYRGGGESALGDGSRRPRCSPARIDAATERKVVRLRIRYPAWGGRKLRKILENQGHDVDRLPAVSTISRILFRGGMISSEKSAQHRALIRFEHDSPNDLWQMDFKGHIGLSNELRCHPLTVIDDHSRYCLCLRAFDGETTEHVKGALVLCFQRHGLPLRILCDNGAPWGTGWQHSTPGRQRYTRLGVWLLRQGVRVSHGRPFHPQTQGKDERLHRTLKEELLMHKELADFPAAQRSFDAWREQYNSVRPHEALDLAVPASRYRKSPRVYQLNAQVQYGCSDQVRKVDSNGLFHFGGIKWRLGEAFGGEVVAIRPSEEDGLLSVIYAGIVVAGVDVKKNQSGRVAICCAEPPVAALPAALHSKEKVLPMS